MPAAYRAPIVSSSLSPSPAERALYFHAAARAVRHHLAHTWVVTRQPPLERAPSEWKPGDKTPEER